MEECPYDYINSLGTAKYLVYDLLVVEGIVYFTLDRQ
jgi:hypothetical protein